MFNRSPVAGQAAGCFFFFFSSPLPVTLTGLLQEGQFLETTLQGYSVAFWKA